MLAHFESQSRALCPAPNRAVADGAALPSSESCCVLASSATSAASYRDRIANFVAGIMRDIPAAGAGRPLAGANASARPSNSADTDSRSLRAGRNLPLGRGCHHAD